jgi:periplasmic protein TonB
MPAELFRSDLPSTPVRRRASLLPLSIVVHAAVITAVVVAPIIADGELPPPAKALPMTYTKVAPLPPPPAIQVRSQTNTQTRTTSPDKPPIDAPTTIGKESTIEPPTGVIDLDVGPDTGFPDGVPGGLPQNVVEFVPPPPPLAERKPVRPGGVIETPKILKRVQPVYPTIAQIARVQGTVVIDALIGEDGKVRNARVLQGNAQLNDAALAAVRQWVFTPTKLNGEPVAVLMTVTVVFTLN